MVLRLLAWICWLIAGLLLIGLVCIFISFAGPSLPPIKDPTTLVAECTTLASLEPKGRVNATNWPSSIQALHPRRVYVGEDDVMIFTSIGIGGWSEGYCVSLVKPSIENSRMSRDLSPTEYPQIFRYNHQDGAVVR